MFSVTDTIVAIATPPGRGGIGVVRLSGPGALAIAQRLTTREGAFEPRRATFTNVRLNADTGRSEDRPLQVSDTDRPEYAALRQESITVRQESGTVRRESGAVRQESGPGRPTPLDETIDHAVVTYFPAPASYTGDDVVELSAHGSPVVLRGIVTAAIARGARLAEPGEFTLRAFLNGRIDLMQAEAVADLIDAATPLQARAAFDQLEGTLTRAIGDIDAALFDLVARLEASVDFPDEGYHFLAPGDVAEAVEKLLDRTRALLAGARR